MSAERGWLGEPPPEGERTPPSHATKWYKMMGATNLLPEEEREAIRQAKQQVGEDHECAAWLDH